MPLFCPIGAHSCAVCGHCARMSKSNEPLARAFSFIRRQHTIIYTRRSVCAYMCVSVRLGEYHYIRTQHTHKWMHGHAARWRYCPKPRPPSRFILYYKVYCVSCGDRWTRRVASTRLYQIKGEISIFAHMPYLPSIIPPLCFFFFYNVSSPLM